MYSCASRVLTYHFTSDTNRSGNELIESSNLYECVPSFPFDEVSGAAVNSIREFTIMILITAFWYHSSISIHTVYPKKYAHDFVVLCVVVVMQSFIMNSHEVFIHIHQGCFPGTGAIVRLPQCQWSKPDGYGKISQCITTTKHSKAKTVCIFLGINCTSLWISNIFLNWRYSIKIRKCQGIYHQCYTYFSCKRTPDITVCIEMDGR